MPPEKDLIRVKAQAAAKAKFRENQTDPDAALKAYLEVMIAGRIDTKYPSSRPGMATNVTISDVNGGMLRAMVTRDSPQGEACIGTSLEGLISRMNDKYFPDDAASRISLQGAQVDVGEAQRAVAISQVLSAIRQF